MKTNKFRLFFIFLIFLLVQTFPTFASTPNGKGLICKCLSVNDCPKWINLFFDTYISPNKIPSEIAIIFENNKATYYYIQIVNDKIRYVKEELGAYGAEYPFYTTKNSIKWSMSKNNNTTIDRKTLRYMSLEKDKYKNINYYYRQCDVFKKDDIFKELKKLVSKYQNEHNAFLKDNNI